MSRGKIKRKSTAIDMTAMCDVAFLLLSFFILTAKFKPAEAVPINIPGSVASTAALLNTDAFIVTITPDGKVLLELSDKGIRENVLNGMEAVKSEPIDANTKKAFLASEMIPVPFAQLSSYLQLSPDQAKKVVLPGIPMDSAGGELKDWVQAALYGYGEASASNIHFIIKGDNATKYPNFSNVLAAFKKNQIFRFQLLTSPHDAPVGSEMYKDALRGEKQD
jgi:biopolymer transport protein ExbD